MTDENRTETLAELEALAITAYKGETPSELVEIARASRGARTDDDEASGDERFHGEEVKILKGAWGATRFVYLERRFGGSFRVTEDTTLYRLLARVLAENLEHIGVSEHPDLFLRVIFSDAFSSQRTRDNNSAWLDEELVRGIEKKLYATWDAEVHQPQLEAIRAKQAKLVPNVPTKLGVEAGSHLARLIATEIEKMRQASPDFVPPCDECAFVAGTAPNGCPDTVIRAFQSVVFRDPFYCHKGVDEHAEPKRLCSGYVAATEGDSKAHARTTPA